MTTPHHTLVYADPRVYSAHPHAARLGDGGIAVVFNRVPRRGFILHPPQDPYFENVLVFSADDGATWTVPSVVPDYGWSGVECAGLTVTGSGQVLLNQWRFRWHPLPLARRLKDREPIDFPDAWVGALAESLEIDAGQALAAAPEELAPWARGRDGTYVHISSDAGQSFDRTVRLSTDPYSGGYGMRGAVELDDGTLVLPLCDVPDYARVFVVCSRDGGATWEPPVAVAADDERLYEEPAPLLLPGGRILLAIRENRNRTIFTTHSDDGGASWSEPAPTGIDGYPPHLLQLADGRVLCTYGFRKPPFQIRAVLSRDGGATWDTANPVIIRSGLPNKDLGYPCTVPIGDGHLLTVYYAQDASGTTGIWATRWSLGSGDT